MYVRGHVHINLATYNVETLKSGYPRSTFAIPDPGMSDKQFRFPGYFPDQFKLASLAGVFLDSPPVIEH